MAQPFFLSEIGVTQVHCAKQPPISKR